MSNHELTITWGISRGRDTYGYTTCTLRDRGEKIAACSGGGYDMLGTVFGEFLEKVYQDRLLKLAGRKGRFAKAIWNGKKGEESAYERVDSDRMKGLYGATYYPKGSGGWSGAKDKPRHVALDGACGFSSMERIAKAIGFDIRRVDAGRKCDVIILTDTREAKS